jgi:hypothetical protein
MIGLTNRIVLALLAVACGSTSATPPKPPEFLSTTVKHCVAATFADNRLA